MNALHNYNDANDLHTLRDWLRFTVSAFNEAKLSFGHGSTNAYDEAVYLILHTLHLPLDTLEPFLDAHITPHERNALLVLLTKRVESRLPAAYLTHEAWLGEYRFYVDERVIVPRSFIAELLRDQLTPWINEPESINYVLDLCTGSGCLAIIAADAFRYAEVDAVDISMDALAVAQINIADYGLQERVRPIASDLFANLMGRQYDLIISNPPYVDAESVASLPQEYRHEPKIALGSGEDGLDATHAILQNAARYLTENCVLVVEIGHNRDALEEAYPDRPFIWLDVAAGDEFVFMLHRNDLL